MSSSPFVVSRAGSAPRLLIRVLPATLAVAGLMLGLASETWAAFTGGPSVRVIPNTSVEIRWTANFVGEGWVEIFGNPNGGVFIDAGTSPAAAGHTIDFSIGGLLQAERTYFFRVRHRDPTGVLPDLTNDPAPYPPFFTGAQAISNVHVESITTNSAVISWEANVIGYGSVVYGTAALDQGPVEDTFNVTNHAIELTGLSPGTIYQFRVSNRHAIDGTSLADATGQFTTEDAVPVEGSTWGRIKSLYD
jgi:hypothetical protein